MGAMVLHEVLATRRNDVMLRWREDVRGRLAPDAMSTVELLDHLPAFLDVIIDALREGTRSARSTSPSAARREGDPISHGEQRLRLGFSLDSVVREYGALRDAIVGIAKDAGVQITFEELQVVFDVTIDGIAHAVTEYTYQREAELMRQTNEHFAFVAHELRNPLSSATAAFRLLQTKSELPTASAPRTVAALQRGLERTAELVDQTLRIAHVASGVELQRSPTTLAELFEEAEMGVIAEAHAKRIELKSRVEARQTFLLDRRLMQSAIDNLLRNAVKYSAPGSMVEVSGRFAEERVIIEVADGCGGIEPEQIERAFGPFIRLNQTETGFGLGLAIAKQATDAHGGRIRVQNVPGRGCIFVLELPQAHEGAQGAGSA